MKKRYESPIAEKIRFDYREQVVATSGGSVPIAPTDPVDPIDPNPGDSRTYFSDGCNIKALLEFGYDICGV